MCRCRHGGNDAGAAVYLRQFRKGGRVRLGGGRGGSSSSWPRQVIAGREGYEDKSGYAFKRVGGAERLFVDLCRALADDGHQVQAVCHPEFEAVSQLGHDRIGIAPLRVKWDWSPLAEGALGRIFRDFSPQVIHSHLCRGSAVAGDAGAKAGIPVIANMHNYANLKYYRNISHFCPGTADQKRYLMDGGVTEKNISVIPHFSMIPVAEKETAVNGDESPVLVSFGRFVHKKGFHILIDAIKILVDSGLDIKLVLGGDGPEHEKLRNSGRDTQAAESNQFSWMG